MAQVYEKLRPLHMNAIDLFHLIENVAYSIQCICVLRQAGLPEASRSNNNFNLIHHIKSRSMWQAVSGERIEHFVNTTLSTQQRYDFAVTEPQSAIYYALFRLLAVLAYTSVLFNTHL